MSKTAFIILTSECNRSCPFCFYRQEPLRRRPDRLTLSKLLLLVNDLGGQHFNEITLTGGEPLLRKKVVLRVIHRARQLGFVVNLNTNGVLLNKSLIQNLRFLDLTRIYLNSQYLDVLSPDILISLSKIPLTIIHVVTKDNVGNFIKIKETAKRLSAEFIVQPAYISESFQNRTKFSLDALPQKEWLYLKHHLLDWAKENYHEKYLEFILSYYQQGPNHRPASCHMGIDDIVIDSDGSVFPCFHRQDLLAGNILRNNLQEVLTRMKNVVKVTCQAQCFGEHCFSLFYG